MLPDESIDHLVNTFGLTLKDAKTLVSLDDGARLDYFDGILTELGQPAENIKELSQNTLEDAIPQYVKYGKTVANWLVHRQRSV